MIRKGTFTSVWDDGTVHITTDAELDTETGEIIYCESVDVGDVDIDILNREYFTDTKLDEEFEVCTTCHEYILKSIMVDGIGSCIDEIQVCCNPDCENNVN